MGGAEGTSDFQFLANDEGAFGADNLHLDDTLSRPSLDGLKIQDVAEVVDFQVVADITLCLFLCKRYCPTVEISSFLIVVVEHLLDNLRVVCVAERIFDALEIG